MAASRVATSDLNSKCRVATDPGKPGKTLFFQNILKTWKSQGNLLKNLVHYGKVRDFSSEISFDPFSILILSIRNSR